MTISASELKWYRSKVVSETSANGGRMGTNEVSTDVKNNVFPDVSQNERNDGVTKYRKLFMRVANASNEILHNSLVHMFAKTPADDYVSLFEGTNDDTQGDISSPREYGIGVLDSDVAAGDSSCDVQVDDTSLDIFKDGDTIFISDGSNSEYHSNVTVSKDATLFTINLEDGGQFLYNYSSSNTIVASCISNSTVETDITNFSTSTTDGSFNDYESNITVSNIGSIYEEWTIEFTSSSDFTATGSLVGEVGTGSISSEFSPNNPDFNEPYFTISTDAWGGTWAEGDTVTFTTHPPHIPTWFKQVVPAGSASYSGNNFKFRVFGETN